MSEILLQTIVEKLESMQIASLKEKDTGKIQALHEALLKEIRLVQSEIIKLPSQFKVSAERMGELLKSTRDLNLKLEKPMNEKIKHSHHLHKGIWIAVGLFIISLLLLYGLINYNNAKRLFEANDIKYRFLKVNGNIGLLKLLYQTDSLYNLNNESFYEQVLEKEQNFSQQEKLLRLEVKRKRMSEIKK